MSERLIAVYTGPTQHTRVLEAKPTSKALMTNLKKDLVWNEANRWTVDVSDISKEVVEYLESDPDFKLEKRDVADEAVESLSE